jgi:predicted RNase H-like HicB family nuclease
VYSQGETIDELLENIKDAYQMILDENKYLPVKDFKTMKLQLDL